MFRLNVAASQLDECVSRGMFALSGRPRISPGEILLLQLKKSDSLAMENLEGRIRHALIFQRSEMDPDGRISRKHWPNAERVWKWILYSSAVLNTKAFSLELLNTTRRSHYQSQANPVRIEPSDEAIILPYLDWNTLVPLAQSRLLPDEDVHVAADNTGPVDDFAVERAILEVNRYFPKATVEIMAHNNPGFDLLAREDGQVVRYVEVKGTRSHRPVFFLSECERRFSEENTALYTLLVVWSVDLAQGTYQVARHDGEMVVDSMLRPDRYKGRLPSL